MANALKYHFLIAVAVLLILAWLWLAVWWYECHSDKYKSRFRYVSPPDMPTICYVMRVDR